MAGKKITDHASFISKDGKFSTGVKTKSESSAAGAGEVGKYEDTTETIKAQQSAGAAKLRGRPMKDGDRN